MTSILLMGVIVLTRLGGTLLALVLIARFLPLPDFGSFVSGYSLAMIVAVAVDYGFAQSLLKDIGADQDNAPRYIGDGLRAKFILSAFALLAAPLLAGWFFRDCHAMAVFLILVCFALCNSFAEYFGSAMRAIGRYHEEAVIQSLCTIAMIAGIMIAGYLQLKGASFAGILAASKLIQLLGVLTVLMKHIPLGNLMSHWSRSLFELKRCVPYAADQGTLKLLDNVDVLIVSYSLGATSAGIYQAGQKLMLGFSAVGMILSNVYLPRLAAASRHNKAELRSLSVKLAALMTVTAIAGLAIFALDPKPLIDFVFGARFAALVPLMPQFGVLLSLRLLGGILGILLTALGMQSVRLMANLVCLALVLATAAWLVRQFGIAGMIYSQLASVILLTCIYAATMFRMRSQFS